MHSFKLNLNGRSRQEEQVPLGKSENKDKKEGKYAPLHTPPHPKRTQDTEHTMRPFRIIERSL